MTVNVVFQQEHVGISVVTLLKGAMVKGSVFRVINLYAEENVVMNLWYVLQANAVLKIGFAVASAVIMEMFAKVRHVIWIVDCR